MSMMALPNEILSQILRGLLADAKIHLGDSQATVKLLAKPYRCKTLCITVVNRRLHNLAWAYLNCNCSFTTDHLSEHGQKPSTQHFLSRNGDVKEWKGIMLFKQIAKLTVLPHQLINMNSKAKRIHPVLIHFPNLQQLTLQLHWDNPAIFSRLGKQDEVERLLRMIQIWLGQSQNEAHDFVQMPPRHRLLSKVERKVDIRIAWHDREECAAIVTKHGTEVTSAFYEAKLWEEIWDDVFNIKGIPSNNWKKMWTNGGSSYKEWIRTH